MAAKKGTTVSSGDLEIKLAILEQVPTPIMAVDRGFNVVFMNPAGCSWLGKEQEDIVGRKCFDLWQTPHCQTPECHVRRAMEMDQVFTARNEIRREGEIGIEVVAKDDGPGIPEVELALQDGFSTGGGLGGGLPGVRRLMDEFEIASTVGVGTRVVARKWQRLAPA